MGINVSHAGGHARHALLCYQEEEGLGGVQINLVPDRDRCRRGDRDVDKDMPAQTGANHLPEQTQELTQGELEGNQELCLVQQGEGLFTEVTFNDYLKTKARGYAVSKKTDGFALKILSGTLQAICLGISSEWCTLHLFLFLERHTIFFLKKRCKHNNV